MRSSIVRLGAAVAPAVARRTLPRVANTAAALAAPRCAVAPAPRALACRVQQLAQRRAYSAGGPLARAEVEGRIVNILSGFDKVTDATKITPNAHFANDLGLDSLDTVEVVMAIEEEFSIEIPDKDADAIHSVPQAVEYILKQSDAH